MNTYKQAKHRQTKEEQEGMDDLLARVKEIRTHAVKEQPENPQKELDLNE